MLNRYDLPDILYKTIKNLGGKANIVEVCKYIWDNYQTDLENSGDLFYTWQYDIRWAATELRKTNRMLPVEQSPHRIWVLM